MGTDFKAWLLTTDHYAFSTTKIETSSASEDFESWFLTNGGYLHPSVEIASDGDDGNFVRVNRKQVLLSGSIVVSCPHQLTISWPSLNQYHFPHVHSTFTPHVATRLFLAKQRLLKAQSPWWPYINSLPLTFSTPLWYDDNDLVWLQGTNLGKAKEIREEAWRQEYERAMQSLFANGFGSEEKQLWTWELYLWAATVMTTRSFAGPASFNRNKGDLIIASDGVGRCPALIPGLDLLNHNPSAKISWIWDVNVCALKVGESVEQGCQVWNNYDPKSNEELIMGYGFSLIENTSDHYGLGFSPPIAAYIKATKARRSARMPKPDAVQSQSTVESDHTQPKLIGGSQVLESSEDFNVNEILDQNIHWVRIIEGKSYEFSPHFLEYFSIAVENPREARLADDRSASETHFSNGDLSRNQLHVICAVIMILEKGQKAIRKYDKDLPEGPQNPKQVDAARYRNGQLKILDNVLDSMCTFLKLVTAPNPPGTRDPRVVRLEHILTNSPKSLLKDLRAVLNAGLRTRDPIKIRERGGVDFAFTAWLCGLWIYSQSNPEGEDEINPTYLRWLHFLQKNYAEPCEKPNSRQKPESPIFEERAEWFDPVRCASGDAASDLGFIARSYLDAVRAAAAKRPRSVYSDGRITAKRLEWCLDIVKNEGVWCPNLDQGEDDGVDDWILFIELGESSCQDQTLLTRCLD